MMTNERVNTTTILNNLVQQFRDFGPVHQQELEDELLRRRADQYAAEPDESDAGDSLTVLTFVLGGEYYGLDVTYVTGVRRIARFTRVPGAPPFYPGVVNLRGAVLTLFDLRRFFDLPGTEEHTIDELVVVATEDLSVGLMVTRVDEVVDVPRPELNTLDDVRYVLGAYVNASRKLVILDAREIFNDGRLRGKKA